MNPKIVVLTCMHNRAHIADLFVRACKLLPNTEVFAVVTDTDTDSQLMCKKHGVKFIKHANQPLGAKWNAGIGHALQMNPDYVVISGDDDILTSHWYDAVLPYMQNNTPFGGLDSCYVLKYGSEFAGAKIKYGIDKVIGCGTFIRADVLRMASEYVKVNWLRGAPKEYMNKPMLRSSLAKMLSDNGRCKIVGNPVYKLWDDHQNKILDFVRDCRIAEVGYAPVVIKTEKPTMIDIKSSQNIWSFEKIFSNKWAEMCTFEEVISIMPDL